MFQAIRAVASDDAIMVNTSRLITALLLSYKQMQDMGHFWTFMTLISGLDRSNRADAGPVCPAPPSWGRHHANETLLSSPTSSRARVIVVSSANNQRSRLTVPTADPLTSHMSPRRNN
jgi:hypothetical protein